jgi:hypothetical protein
MSTSTAWHLLPADLIELQLGQIDLLLAMYPDETVLEESSRGTIHNLRSVGEGSSKIKFTLEPSVSIMLQVPVSSELTLAKTLQLDLTFPFTYDGSSELEEAPRSKVRIVQPAWLSKSATTHLTANVPEDDDLLGIIEHIQEAAAKQLEALNTTTLNSTPQATSSTTPAPLVRVWFYFPSISTRSKRDDFIIHAPSYALTGFLYAGKPGLLCVEGASQSIDDYMKFIKTESWGDIPAHHKKVSERYRETQDVQRVFAAMTEITDLVGERRGQRANRGDMKAVEEWLMERGLGGAFTKVLM